MAKFGFIENDGSVSDERFDTLDKAVEAARKDVSDTPDTEVEVIQFLKKIESTLNIEETDIV